MSATLTWHVSGLGTKTGTTNVTFLTDLAALVASNSGDADFKWEVASLNDSSTPMYLVLKRKDASAGRILFVVWTSSPAANNAAILDQSPTTNNIYGAWFPAGNVDTPSNLAAASGTILGDDTGCTKVASGIAAGSFYPASFVPYYFDSEEALVVCTQNPAGVPCCVYGFGDLVVDEIDDVYGAVFADTNFASFGSNTGTGCLLFTTVVQTPGAANQACLRTRYDGTERPWFIAFRPSGVWANQVVGVNDVLTDTSEAKAWFIAPQLMAQGKKGGGFPIKLRQIAWGPGTTAALEVYNTVTLTPAAIQMNALTGGGSGRAWAVNFKL
jgi:hypothetical protein